MIVDFDVDATVLESTITAVPDAFITLADVSLIDDEIRVVFWVSGCAFEELEAALERDDSVESFNQIAATDSERLYRITHAQTSSDVKVYTALVSRDGIPIRVTNEGAVWRVKAQFPSRAHYNAFKQQAGSNGVDITERAVFNEEPTGHSPYYGLTNPQRETLLAAIELGYFSIPRDASLATLASHLDISPNAASERLRRAIETLVRNTLYRDHRDKHE